MSYPRCKMITVMAATLAILAPQASMADLITYRYTGDTFNDIKDGSAIAGTYNYSQRIEGWVTVDVDPLAVADYLNTFGLMHGSFDIGYDLTVSAYSFTDGRQTMQSGDGSSMSFDVRQIDHGVIRGWNFSLSKNNGNESMSSYNFLHRNTVDLSIDSMSSDDVYMGADHWPNHDFATNRIGGYGVTTGSWTRDNFTPPSSPPPIASAVPEPETYAMLLAGLGLLGFTARRRENNTA